MLRVQIIEIDKIKGAFHNKEFGSWNLNLNVVWEICNKAEWQQPV